jgi:hypothetical protein
MVGLEAPEGILRVNGFSWRAELFEQGAERRIDLVVGDEARGARSDASKRQEYEQGFVRGTFVTALPHVEGGNAGENFVAGSDGRHVRAIIPTEAPLY